MSEQLSVTMRAAIDYAQRNNGKLIRYPGGFWAPEGWRLGRGNHFGTTTIQALVSRGVAKYTTWQDRDGGGQFPVEITVSKPERDADTLPD